MQAKLFLWQWFTVPLKRNLKKLVKMRMNTHDCTHAQATNWVSSVLSHRWLIQVGQLLPYSTNVPKLATWRTLPLILFLPPNILATRAWDISLRSNQSTSTGMSLNSLPLTCSDRLLLFSPYYLFLWCITHTSSSCHLFMNKVQTLFKTMN